MAIKGKIMRGGKVFGQESTYNRNKRFFPTVFGNLQQLVTNLELGVPGSRVWFGSVNTQK